MIAAALSLSSAVTTFCVRLGGRGTIFRLADPVHAAVGFSLPDADASLDERFDFTSPTYDWGSDYLLCEERALASLDDDADDEDDWELAADRALRAAEADQDDDEFDDDPRPDDENDDHV